MNVHATDTTRVDISVDHDSLSYMHYSDPIWSTHVMWLYYFKHFERTIILSTCLPSFKPLLPLRQNCIVLNLNILPKNIT